MILDPETRAAVIEATAKKLADMVVGELGGLDQVILIDVRTAAQCLGVTRAYVSKKFDTFHVTDRTTAIRLSDLKTALAP
jgi:hypothetical protein